MDVADKKNRAVGVIFLSVILIMFVLIISGAVIQKVNQYYIDRELVWNAAEFYPFPEREKQETSRNISQGKQLSKVLAELEEKIEWKATSHFYFRMPFVLVKKVLDNAVGLDMTMSQTGGELVFDDAVVTWEGDSLGYVINEFDISEQIDSLVAFGEEMEAEGRNFLVFFVPEKCAGNEVYQDYSVEKEQEIIAALTAADLDFVYVSKEMQKQGIDIALMFFKTDHHWLPSTGIWADGLLCDTLNEKYGYEFDSSIFDMENYVTTLMPDGFLGSQGKKVTDVYTKREDFPVIIPKYDTSLEVFSSKTSETNYGSIEETLLDPSILEEANIYFRDSYSFYGWGNQALFQIHNNDKNDGNHILLIKASSANVMYPFLPAAMENLDVLDPRYFEGSIEAYIHDRRPDTIVVVYGVRMFNGDIEDRRLLFDFR